MTVCLWGISVGLRLGLGLLCRVRDLGTGEVLTRGLWMNQTMVSWPAAQRLPSCSLSTYPRRSPEGAKTPLPGGPTVGISVKLLSLKTGLCLVPPGLE